MIEVKNLTKRYGNYYAIKDLNFTVNDGEIVGFLGPNGAGKSTTMNILTGYLSSTEGSALIGGYDILEEPFEAKKRIGYLPEIPPIYMDMTVKEYLNFVYDLKKVELARGPHIQEICSLVKLNTVYNRLIKNLSKGYKQRVGIAQAMLGNPEVLILDEPTVGLDPSQIIEIRTLIKKLGKKHTVILSSHILSEVQAVCDRVIVINKGQMVADGTTEELTEMLSAEHKVTLRTTGEADKVEAAVKAIENVENITKTNSFSDGSTEFMIESADGIDLRAQIGKTIIENGWYILVLKPLEMSLEDIFLELTKDKSKKGGKKK